MGLQGGHVIPVALVLKQDGEALTGTVSMPTQKIGQTVDVALKGDDRQRRVHADRRRRRRQGADDDRDHAGKLNDEGMLEGTRGDGRRRATAIGDMPYTAERLKERRSDRRCRGARCCKGLGATRGAPLPRGDGAGAPASAAVDAATKHASGLHRDGARLGGQLGDRHQEEPVGAGGGRPRLRSHADQPALARAVPRHPHHRQQHRRRSGEPVHARRKSAAIISDRAPRSSRRRIRSRRRAATCMPASRSISSTRSGSARTRRSRRCSCASRTSIRPAAAATATLRLHRRDQLGGGRQAAADDPRSARRVRQAVRRAQGRRRRRRSARSGWRRIAASSTGCCRSIDAAAEDARRRRSRAARRLSRSGARDRAAHPDRRGAQPQRRAARAAGGAGGRARFVQRARQADVRPAGARLRVRRHAGVRVQARSRRLEPRLSRERLQGHVPRHVASQRQGGQDPQVRDAQHAFTSA